MFRKIPLKAESIHRLSIRFAPLVIFLATLVAILLVLTSLIFPVLLTRSTSGIQDFSGINPYETGVWTYPLLVADVIFFGACALYFTNRLPKKITNSIKFIFSFEVSAQVAFLAVTTLVGLYIVLTISQLFTVEVWEDYPHVIEGIGTWNIASISHGYNVHLKYFLDTVSKYFFGIYKVAPFLESIALLVLTYFTTTEITNKRFSGIVSMSVLFQSNLFLTYSTSVSYDNSWILLYLLSLYAINKKWPVSPISFILSLFSKVLTAVFIPLTFFFTYRTEMPRKKKLFVVLSYLAITIIGLVITLHGTGIVNVTGFKYYDFWLAYNAISYQLRYDGFILLFLLPLSVGLFLASRKGIYHSDSIMLLILGMIITQPILAAVTDQHAEPYRLMPLVVFFAIGVGTTISKRFSRQASLLSSI